jgi:hypothetical protein
MEKDKNDEIYSKVVRAGKRTYFFDIKSTKGNDLYITLTESKRTFDENGRDNFEKHKIFLYKEDFEKFREGLDDVLTKIETYKSGNSNGNESHSSHDSVSFEDLT